MTGIKAEEVNAFFLLYSNKIYFLCFSFNSFLSRIYPVQSLCSWSTYDQLSLQPWAVSSWASIHETKHVLLRDTGAHLAEAKTVSPRGWLTPAILQLNYLLGENAYSSSSLDMLQMTHREVGGEAGSLLKMN